MDKKIILALDQLNQEFYQENAVSFDRSRQYSWPGWQKLLPKIKSPAKKDQTISVLDAGCGNARFAQFLHEHQIKFTYLGIDSSPMLLAKARKNLNNLDIKFKLQALNIVKLLLEEQLAAQFSQKFDFIVAFGILHHIPSFKLRQKFIKLLGRQLKTPQSLLAITAWQFAAYARFNSKKIPVQQFAFDSNKLERNDFILGWQKQNKTARYCHFVDEKEVKELKNNLSCLNLNSDFLADGKNNKLNRYLVWQKSA